METLKLYFADQSTIILSEDDYIVPVNEVNNNDRKDVSIGKLQKLYLHTNDGLIPSFLEAINSCRFFYIKNNDYLFAVSTIVKMITS